MSPPSSFPEKCSQPDIVQPLTVSLLPVANLALSFLKLVSVNFRTLVGQTHSCSTCKLLFFFPLTLVLFANPDIVSFFFSFFFQFGNFSIFHVDRYLLHPPTSWDQGPESRGAIQRRPKWVCVRLVLVFFLAVLFPLILFVKQLPGERLDRLFWPPPPSPSYAISYDKDKQMPLIIPSCCVCVIHISVWESQSHLFTYFCKENLVPDKPI